VFQTFPWNACWWKAFGGPHELMLNLAHVGSDLVGIAPMMIVRDETPLGRVRKRACFVGSPNHASDYCDFVIDPEAPEALDALLDEVFATSRQWDRLDLSHFPGHSPNRARTLARLANRGAKTAVEFESEASVRVLGNTDLDLKASNKASLRRHINYFKKAGELHFHQCGSESEILEYLDQFFEQHRMRRERTDSPSQFLDPAQRMFYRDLVRRVFPSGWLRIHVVLFDGKPLAFHFGFEYRKRFICTNRRSMFNTTRDLRERC
jgi:CelD/BcsL family acetyltransferase involved in cellulose biosynthesis